ncbi:PHD finger protein 21B isoform X2 [Xenopus laevis]|uniref:PHD finger protein 21B isoform X2 n=1 Tax=Xenopus laevis TaxID=8355 RepID=A0A8J1MJ36_XENLA|nr:PHD finger protein 21B isoform X2 [Xenopus laevis]
MELHSLPEPLPCLQLAVRSCPVGSAKPIPLIKSPSSQGIAISVVPAKAPVTMVTAHLNGQKSTNATAPSATSATEQTAPINLQTTGKLVGGTLNLATRRVSDISHAQALGTITAVPIKIPQVSSLHRLAGHGPAVLPQVRPKTLIPESLSISPCREQPSKQPPTFQKATVVSIKNPSPALPTANNTVGHIPTSASQSQSVLEPTISSPLSGAGVAYAIISASPSNASPINTSTVSVVNDGIKVQPLLISADSKVGPNTSERQPCGSAATLCSLRFFLYFSQVIIIQPQIQSQPECKTEIKKLSEETQTPQGPPAAKKKKEENPEKIAFMVALGLVTTEHLEELQSKRHERKRRSTANPAYSGLLEPERKRFASNYLSNPFISGRANEDLFWKHEITHDEYCSACKRGSYLQTCGACPRAYHLDCLDPPLKVPPKGVWLCPKCQQKLLKKDAVPWSGALTLVQSYVTHKSVKEEEKRKLLKKGNELKNEQRQLEDQERLLNNAMKKCLELKNSLLVQQKGTQSSLERLKTLIKLIQSEQMIQVTMTTTSSSSSPPPLTVTWIKPSSAAANTAFHKALQPSHSNN